MHITFVCTGNTCRSAMAEGIFKRIIEERKIDDITCSSCGLSAFSGDTATPQAIDAAKKYGADISSHRSSSLNRYILESTDIMVCMTLNHKAAVMSVNPKCRLVVPDDGIDDPYGGDSEVYEKCAKQINNWLNRFADSLLMKIEKMSEEHIEQIAEIENLCFSAPWSEESIRAELDNDTSHFLVATCEKNVLGYIGVHEVCDEAYIANVAVKPDYRRLGIGEKLIEKAQASAKDRGCSFISLEVRKSNIHAIELYKKQGYNIVGERKNFYTAPNEDALIMTLNFKDCECK